MRSIILNTVILLMFGFSVASCNTNAKHANAAKDKYADDSVAVPDKSYERGFAGDTALVENKNIYNLMRLIYEDIPDADNDEIKQLWVWSESYSKKIDEYIKTLNLQDSLKTPEERFDMAYKKIEWLIYPYSDGNQSDMNFYCYILYSLQEYKTLMTYKKLMYLVKDKSYQDAVYLDYVNWAKLYEQLQNRYYNDIIESQGSYSMASIDIYNASESFCMCGYAELLDEIKIIGGHRMDFGSRYDWVKKSDFEKQKIWYAMQTDEELKETRRDKLTAKDSVYICLNKWLKGRRHIAKYIKNTAARTDFLNYSKKIKYDVLRFLMNKMALFEELDTKYVGDYDGKLKYLSDDIDKNNYIYYKGKYIYMDRCYPFEDVDNDLKEENRGNLYVIYKNGQVESIKRF